jgi:hypothetical protein
VGAFSDAVHRNDEHRTTTEGRCIVARLTDLMDSDDKDLFNELLSRPVNEIAHTWLVRRLVDAGLEAPSYMSIRRHRNERCVCYGFHTKHGYQTKAGTDG